MKMIELSRPLVTIDVETHALLDPRIVEIAIRVDYHDKREPKRWSSLIDPLVPITPEVTAIHGIKDEDIAGKPTFAKIAQNLASGMTDCDFCGYNVKFDLGVVAAEMARAGVLWSYEGARLLDPLRMWQVVAPRRLGDAVSEYLGRGQSEAHRALGDAEDALEVAMAMIERHATLPKTIDAMHDLCFPRNKDWADATGKLIYVEGKVAIGFGKHRGKALSSLPADYLEWVVRSDFPSDTKRIIGEELAQRKG